MPQNPQNISQSVQVRTCLGKFADLQKYSATERSWWTVCRSLFLFLRSTGNEHEVQPAASRTDAHYGTWGCHSDCEEIMILSVSLYNYKRLHFYPIHNCFTHLLYPDDIKKNLLLSILFKKNLHNKTWMDCQSRAHIKQNKVFHDFIFNIMLGILMIYKLSHTCNLNLATGWYFFTAYKPVLLSNKKKKSN